LKLTPRNKNAIQAFIGIILTAITVITMLYPGLFNYPYSYIAIKEKKESIEDLDTTITKNQNLIENLNNELANMKISAQRREIDAQNIRNGIDGKQLNLHIPSILIALEEGAKENNIDIIIHYDQLKKYEDINSVDIDFVEKKDNEAKINTVKENIDEDNIDKKEELPAESSKKTNEELDEELDEKIDEKIPESNLNIEDDRPYIPEKKENKENKINIPSEGNEEITDNNKEDISEDSTNAISIDEVNPINIDENTKDEAKGIKVATIPITVNGDFIKMREFIRLLDKIDFIEPRHIRMVSSGTTVEGHVLLYIFYGEV